MVIVMMAGGKLTIIAAFVTSLISGTSEEASTMGMDTPESRQTLWVSSVLYRRKRDFSYVDVEELGLLTNN